MCARFGVNLLYIQRVAREAGLAARREKRTAITPEVLERYARGENANAIAQALGVGRTTVVRVIRATEAPSSINEPKDPEEHGVDRRT